MKLLRKIGIVLLLASPSLALATPKGPNLFCCDSGCCPGCPFCPSGWHK